MRGLLLLALLQSGTLRHHFVDDDGHRFELKLNEATHKVSFQLPLPAQQRFLLHLNERKREDESPKLGRYAMGYPMPDYVLASGVVAGGASLLATIIADFATHTRPDRP